MSEGPDDRYAQMAEEARREANEAAERAKADAERVQEEMVSGELKEEAPDRTG